MADYHGDYAGAYFAAVEALLKGGDPEEAARGHFLETRVITYSQRLIVTFAVEAARRDVVKPPQKAAS